MSATSPSWTLGRCRDLLTIAVTSASRPKQHWKIYKQMGHETLFGGLRDKFEQIEVRSLENDLLVR